MNENQFKAGDVVRLKSGGPKMTVVPDIGNGRVNCRWFDGNGPGSRTFDSVALEKCPPEESAAKE